MRTIKRCSRNVLAFDHATGGVKGEAELLYTPRNDRGGAWAIDIVCLAAGGTTLTVVLQGCALRRSELAALACGHIQQRDGRWVFVDLVGKGKRIRTVPIPPFVKVAIDAWTAAAGLSEGPLFRRVRRRKYPEKTPEALSELGDRLGLD